MQVTPNINSISQGMRCVPDGAMNAGACLHLLLCLAEAILVLTSNFLGSPQLVAHSRLAPLLFFMLVVTCSPRAAQHTVWC